MSTKNKKYQRQTASGVISRIRRSPYQSAAAIFTMAVTLFLIGLVGIVSLGSSTVLRHFETRPQVTAFFNTDVNLTQSQVDELQNQLSSLGKVASVRYISKEDALNIYKDLFKQDPILLELVTAKMLPASLEVSAIDPRYLPDISDFLEKMPGIDQVIFQEDVVSALTRWTDALRKVGLGIIIAFMIFSVLIVSVIVSLKVALKKEEIDIVSLVGGTSWYIYKPFFTDSLFYGVIGALIAWFGNVLTILYATPFLISFLSGIPIFPIPLAFYGILLLIELALGMGIGVIASMVALRRYLS